MLVAERVVTGFIEISLRRDYVNGCETSPVGFIEGLFARPEVRGGGGGVVEARECRELAWDVLLDNEASQACYRAAWFTETQRVVFFRKPLG